MPRSFNCTIKHRVVSNHLQNAEATLAVSSTGSGPTPPRGMSRTDDRTFRRVLLVKLSFSTPVVALGGRNARPEGKRDAVLGSAVTSRVARKGRSFILLVVPTVGFGVTGENKDEKSLLAVLVCTSPRHNWKLLQSVQWASDLQRNKVVRGNVEFM